MHHEQLTPFVYPFLNTLIDQHGNLCDVEIRAHRPEYITPGIIVTTDCEEPTPDRVLILGNANKTFRFVSKETNRLPQYIGRNMIRLNIAPDARDDRYVDLNLNEISTPDRAFGGHEFAAFIWDDEQLALIDAPSDIQPENPSFRRFTLATPHQSNEQPIVTFPIQSLNMTRPSPWIIATAEDLKRRFVTVTGSPLSQYDRFHYAGHTQDYYAIRPHKGDKELIILDRQLNETARIPFKDSAFITSANRVVTLESKDYMSDSDTASVYTIHGELIREIPDFKYGHYHRTKLSQDTWLASGAPSEPLNIYNAELELVGSIPPERKREPRLSPDGRLFFMIRGNQNTPTQFKMFAPTGELLNAFSYGPIPFAISRAQAKNRNENEKLARRNFQYQPKLITFRQTIYEANMPKIISKDHYFGSFPLEQPHEPGHGWYFVTPFINGNQCCPVCGSSWGDRPFFNQSHQGTYGFCKHCKWDIDVYDPPYDDSLDHLFGGQFGKVRKRWLDKSGWKQEDLDRIEHVFQIDTANWPRPSEHKPGN